MTEKIQDRLEEYGWSEDYELVKVVGEAKRRIDELEAALLDISRTGGVTMAITRKVAAALSVKSTEEETPKRQKTDDHIVRLSDETAIDYVLPNDYLEHKQDMERSRQELIKAHLDLGLEVGRLLHRIEALEERMSAASPNVSYRYSNWCEEESDPTPASHGSEDKTLDTQEEALRELARLGQEIDRETYRNRRSGKERRVSWSEEIASGKRFAYGGTYQCRRKIARRKSDRREE